MERDCEPFDEAGDDLKMVQLSKHNKQVVVLYVSSVIGLLIGVLNSVINTRALAPDLYGDFRYVQNIISFVSSLLLFGYFVSGSRLLALSKDEQYSRQIRGILCTILAITVGLLMLTMAGLYVISVIQGKDNLSLLYLISIPLCGNVTLLNYVNTTAQGDNHIGRIAAARVLPSAVYCVLAYLIYHYYGATPGKMLALYNGSSLIILLFIIVSTKPSFANLRESFRVLNEENKQYGFNVYIGSLANVSTGYLAGITLGLFCADNSNVGFYTLAGTIAAPLAMLPSIIGTTYFKQFASQDRIDNKVMLGSVGLTVISCIAFILLVKYIVLFLYDKSYYCVAKYAAWIAVGTSMHGLGDMFNRFLGAHGQGKQIRNGAFACGIVLIVGSFVLVYFFQISGAVITKIASSAVYLGMMIYYYVKFVLKDD